MINLARHVDRDNPQVDPEVQASVYQELTEAGININNHDFLIKSCGEVPTSIIGTLCGWTFRRAWRYWTASGPGIPAEIAEEFNATWGSEVRVEGFAGGISPLGINEGFAIGSYHIDTQEGLNAFVGLLKSIHKPKLV